MERSDCFQDRLPTSAAAEYFALFLKSFSIFAYHRCIRYSVPSDLVLQHGPIDPGRAVLHHTYWVCASPVGLIDEVFHDDRALTFVAAVDKRENVADAKETVCVKESLLVIC